MQPYTHSPSAARTSAATIKRINNRHMEVVRLLFAGVQENIIAIHTGYSAQQVCNIANSPIVRMRLEQLHEKADTDTLEVSKNLRRASIKASQVINNLMDDPNTPHGVLVRAALGALDRSGFAPEKNIKVTNRNELAITADVIQDIKVSYEENQRSLNGLTQQLKEAVYATDEGNLAENNQPEYQDGSEVREAS